MEKHTVSKLIGAPPGYIGYEQGGQLTEAIRRKPYSIILFDEIEKAHPEIFNTLLQILDDGRLTDSQGRTVDFKNTIIIMTSNLGSELLLEEKSSISKTTKDKIFKEIQRHFRPEFLNRIDEIILFEPLKIHEIKKIVNRLISDLNEHIKDKQIVLEAQENAREWIAEKGYDPVYGARPLKRFLQRHIETPLAKILLSETFKEGQKIECYLDKDQLQLRIKS